MDNKNTTVRFSCSDSIAYLLLDLESRHNALGQHELDQLQTHLSFIAKQPQLRALVLTGAGNKTFCSGAALDQLDGEQFNGDNFAAITTALAALEIPTICALNGNVFGAGVDLALACDFRIGLFGIRMRIPAAAIGVCYPPQSIHRITSELGIGPARRLLMLAETFDAEAMLACGFLYQLVTLAELNAAVNNLLVTIKSLAPLSIVAMKQIIRQTENQQLDAEAAKALVDTCFASQDFREGLAALKAKRAPDFRGS